MENTEGMDTGAAKNGERRKKKDRRDADFLRDDFGLTQPTRTAAPGKTTGQTIGETRISF